MTPVAILILAAGASSRMQGRDKLAQPIDSTPLLTRVTGRALATGCTVYVTLPSLDHPRAALIGAAIPLPVPDAAQGMAHSIVAGVRAIPDDSAILLLPGDMPDIKTPHISSIINAFRDDSKVTLQQGATDDGTPGHPVLFPPDCRDDLLALTGDTGALPVIRKHQARMHRVPLPGNTARLDLDTPEAWESYLANRAAKS